MFGELREPVPDIERYLERICVERGYPCRDYLDRLIEQHQKHIPFENLEPYDDHADVSLGIRTLFDKIVERRRGGFCFELNGLFYQLLIDLGFDAYPILARSYSQEQGGVGPALHRASIVRLDGRPYLADVGYGGPQAAFALEVCEGKPQSGCGQTFEVKRYDDWWHTLVYHGSEGPAPVLQFSLAAHDVTAFVPLSHYCCTAQSSYFLANRIVNIRADFGSYSYMNGTLTRFEKGSRTERAIKPEEDSEVLKSIFGIRL